MFNDDAKSLIEASNSDASSLHVRNIGRPIKTITLVERTTRLPIPR
jgi:hypothetical protein